MHHFVAVEFQANQLLRRQRADEQAVLPRLEAWVVVKRHAADGRGFFPDMVRVDHAIDMLAPGFGNRHQRIVDAMGGNRPTKVLAGLGDVDLITATGPVLVGPQLAGPGVERRALLVAVAERPDFRAHVIATDKRVVLGHRAVREDAHQLALQLVQVLRSRPLVVLAKGDEQVAVAVEHQARAKMVAAGELGLLAENHVEVFKLGTVC
ncbi:hypothetical protein D3C81_772980 [compost metagenome]